MILPQFCFHRIASVLLWKATLEVQSSHLLELVGGAGAGWVRDSRPGCINDSTSSPGTSRPVSSGQSPVCDPAWGCGGRPRPGGSPAASSSSSSSALRLQRDPRRETCDRATRLVCLPVVIVVITFSHTVYIFSMASGFWRATIKKMDVPYNKP